MTRAEYFSVENLFAAGVASVLSQHISIPVFYGRTMQELPSTMAEVSIVRCQLASNQPSDASGILFYGHYQIACDITLHVSRSDDIDAGLIAGEVRVALSAFNAHLDSALQTMKTLNIEEASTVWRQKDGTDIATMTFAAEVQLLPSEFPSS